MIKRILSIALVFCISFSQTVFAEKAQDVDDEKLSRILQVLSGLGIMYDASEGENFNPDSTVTRGSAAMIIADFAQINTEGNYKQIFDDVSSDMECFSAVSALMEANIIAGYSDGKFYPEKEAEVREIIKMLLCIMGYYRQAEYMGGYSDGMLKVASDIKLTKGITGNYLEPITRQELAYLLYNALTIPMMSLNATAQAGMTYAMDDEHTVLADKHDAMIAEGIVTANSQTSIYEPVGIAENKVKIGQTVFDVGTSNAEDFIGQPVEYLVKKDENDDYVILGIWIKDTDRVKELQSRYILEGTNLEEIQYEVGSRVAEYRLADNPDLIYNGQSAPLRSEADLMPDLGKVVLSDTDGDNKYDVLIVTSYTLQIVDSVHPESGKIHLKNSTDSFDYENDFESVKFYCDGELIDVSSLEEWNVLEIAMPPQPESGKCIVNVCKNQAGGTLTQRSDDEIAIDGESYELSEYPAANFANVALGQSAILLLDSTGRAVDFKNVISGATCAFLFKVAIDDSDNTIAYAKLFTESGKWISATMKDKVKLNGTKQSVSNVVEALLCRGDAQGVMVDANGMMIDIFGKFIKKSGNIFVNIDNGIMGQQPFGQITKRQLVLVNTNSDGIIKEIQTADASQNTHAFVKRGSYTVQPGLQWREGIRAFYINNWGVSVYPVFYADENCTMFQIPFDRPDEEKMYNVKNAATLKRNDYNCYAETYGYKDDELYDDVRYMIVKAAADTNLSKDFVVESVKNTLDDEEMPITKVCGYEAGVYKEYIIESEVDAKKREGELKFGDFLKFSLNSDNVTVKELYKYDTGDILYNTDRTIESQLGCSGTFRKTHNAVGYISGVNVAQKRFQLRNNTYNQDGNSPVFGMIRSGATYLYVVDMKTKKIRVGNVNDIEVGDVAAVALGATLVESMAIYRNMND